jgi:hypothetical protein
MYDIVLHISRMMCTEREERGAWKRKVGHAGVVHYVLKKENVLRPDPLREVTSDATCSEYLLLLLSLLQAYIVPYDYRWPRRMILSSCSQGNFAGGLKVDFICRRSAKGSIERTPSPRTIPQIVQAGPGT